MAEIRRSALIVARPGRVRDGLKALLKTLPSLETVELADNSLSALGAIANNPPGLILLGSDLSDGEIETVLTQTRADLPEIRYLVLANTIHQEQIARAGGADGVLAPGFSAERFLTTINSILPLEQA